MTDTPIFNIDLQAFDTYILAIRSTDGKILMKLDSDGNLLTTGVVQNVPSLGYYDKDNNEIKGEPNENQIG